MKFYSMSHRGGLDEALKTRKQLSKDYFNKYLGHYEFYSFDSRINCVRFMHRDFPNNGDYPDWLLLEYSITELLDVNSNDFKNFVIDFYNNIKGDFENGK